MPMPSNEKAMNIAFSRPIRSDSQPKSGRDKPLSTSPTDNAKLSAGMVSPSIDTGTLSIAKSLATGASCAGAHKTRPPNKDEPRVHREKGRPMRRARGGVLPRPSSPRARPRRHDLGRLGGAQQQCNRHDHDALGEPEPQIGGLITAGLD